MQFDETQRMVLDAVVDGLYKGTPISGSMDLWAAIFPDEEQRLYMYRLIGKTVHDQVMSTFSHK